MRTSQPTHPTSSCSLVELRTLLVLPSVRRLLAKMCRSFIVGSSLELNPRSVAMRVEPLVRQLVNPPVRPPPPSVETAAALASLPEPALYRWRLRNPVVPAPSSASYRQSSSHSSDHFNRRHPYRQSAWASFRQENDEHCPFVARFNSKHGSSPSSIFHSPSSTSCAILL